MQQERSQLELPLRQPSAEEAQRLDRVLDGAAAAFKWTPREPTGSTDWFEQWMADHRKLMLRLRNAR